MFNYHSRSTDPPTAADAEAVIVDRPLSYDNVGAGPPAPELHSEMAFPPAYKRARVNDHSEAATQDQEPSSDDLSFHAEDVPEDALYDLPDSPGESKETKTGPVIETVHSQDDDDEDDHVGFPQPRPDLRFSTETFTQVGGTLQHQPPLQDEPGEPEPKLFHNWKFAVGVVLFLVFAVAVPTLFGPKTSSGSLQTLGNTTDVAPDTFKPMEKPESNEKMKGVKTELNKKMKGDKKMKGVKTEQLLPANKARGETPVSRSVMEPESSDEGGPDVVEEGAPVEETGTVQQHEPKLSTDTHPSRINWYRVWSRVCSPAMDMPREQESERSTPTVDTPREEESERSDESQGSYFGSGWPIVGLLLLGLLLNKIKWLLVKIMTLATPTSREKQLRRCKSKDDFLAIQWNLTNYWDLYYFLLDSDKWLADKTGYKSRTFAKPCVGLDVSAYEGLKVGELKSILVALGGRKSGNKADLIHNLARKYEATLDTFKKDEIHMLLQVKGVKCPMQSKKQVLIQTLVETGF